MIAQSDRPAWSITLDRDLVLEMAFWLAAILLGAIQAWPRRYHPSTIDLVSYLDVGDAYVRGHWRDALNGYWNPLYSWLLGLSMALVQPSTRYEYPIAKLVDYAIYLFCLASFGWCLTQLRTAYRQAMTEQPAGRPTIPDWAWIVGGYTLFLWSSLTWITLTSNTPDMLAAALAYMAWGLVLGLDERPDRMRARSLGVVLALSYFARTPMFVVSGVLLACLAFRRATRDYRHAVTEAALIFLALTLPFILSISLARGHVTIGDNGMLNHVWLTNPGGYVVPNRHWQGGPPGNGHPRHPSRPLWNTPPAFEFANPIGGTYPPWTDPSYWYEGLRYHFNGAAEWSSLRDNLKFDMDLFGKWLALTLMMIVAAGDPRATLRAVGRHVRFWAPSATGLALYLFANDLLVQRAPTPQPPSRYVAVYAVVVIGVMMFSLRFRSGLAPIVTRTMAWCVPVFSAVLIAALVADQLTAFRAVQPPAPWQVAEDLQEAGVTSGQRVATIGSPSLHVFWAGLAGVQIIAEVPDETAFWSSTLANQEQLVRTLARAGAQAVVAASVPAFARDQGWQVARNTFFGVRVLGPVSDKADARLVSGPGHRRQGRPWRSWTSRFHLNRAAPGS